MKLAMNFPIMISQSLTGEVSNNSMVPSFCSSEISRIVRIGAINIKISVTPPNVV